MAAASDYVLVAVMVLWARMNRKGVLVVGISVICSHLLVVVIDLVGRIDREYYRSGLLEE